MQPAADRLVVGLGRARLYRAGGLIVDPERDGVGDQLVAFALARRGLDGRGAVVTGRLLRRLWGRDGAARACRDEQPTEPSHAAMVARFGSTPRRHLWQNTRNDRVTDADLRRGRSK